MRRTSACTQPCNLLPCLVENMVEMCETHSLMLRSYSLYIVGGRASQMHNVTGVAPMAERSAARMRAASPSFQSCRM